MRRLAPATIVAVVACVPAAALATPATIQSALNGKCLDAGAALVGTKVTLWQCSGTLQQQWDVAITGGTAVIRASSTGRCLDADTNTIGQNGTIVQVWDCNGAPQQQWILRDQGIFSPVAGQALDADTNTSSSDGGIAQLWFPNGAAQQQWSVLVNGAPVDLSTTPCARTPAGSGKRITARLEAGRGGRARATLTTGLRRHVRVTGTLVSSDAPPRWRAPK